MDFDNDNDAGLQDRSTWWRGAVLYQIYPRSFLDSNGDGVGDLRGIIDRLGYVASLGVDGIWLSPFFRSPMKDFGYDVSDYRDVDPIFGTLSDFDVLVHEAHRLGLKVVIDQVYSHTSDQHAWFTESRKDRSNPKADWYVWADPKSDGTPPNNWLAVFGGSAWTWDGHRRQYYLHNFLPSQPDLNAHNPEVQDELLSTARFWFERGVDGFRLDAINFLMHDPSLRDNPSAELNAPAERAFDMQVHLRNQSHPSITGFLERLRAVADEYGDRFTLAEIGGLNPISEMRTFTRRGRLDSAYSFAYLRATELRPELVKTVTEEWPDEPDEGWPTWTFSNHDAPRCITRWHDGSDQPTYAKLMALLLLTLRGNAIVYQGEELGLPQADVPYEKLQDPEAIANWPVTLGRDGARTPIPWSAHARHAGFTTGDVEPWLPIDVAHAPLAVDVQQAAADSVLAFYREVLALRRMYDALRTGTSRFLDAPDGMVVFERQSPLERLLVVLNVTDQRLTWSPPDPSAVVMFTTDNGQLEDAIASPGRVIEPYSGYVARTAMRHTTPER